MSTDKSKMNPKPSKIASKIPTSGRDSGTHSRSSSVSNLTTTSDIHSEIGDAASENVEDFKMDERVWVNGSKPGCIKFLGKTQFAAGIWAGVLLDESVGKNDGSVAGIKYFSCEPLKGIFARPNKLSRTAGDAPGSANTSLVGFVTPKSSTTIPSSRASVCSNVSSTSTRQISKLRVGERVTVSSLGGLKPGTLKFVGETEFAKGEWAGIELDEPTGKNDGSVAGKRYFTCPMKFGLFSPLHKVFRAAATPTSRAGSIRGTPLMRSTSRDSLNSSISNSSRVSRVKLGKTKVSGGGITTTTKALQEALKEKDQYIEQLLKERDLDRAEYARVTTHFQEMEAKSSLLEKQQRKTETDRKGLEEKLITVQKKLEDIQFQLEEEKILKSDFETQLLEREEILKRIENFVSKQPCGTFLNIEEILSGQEILSENVAKQDIFAIQSTELKKKVVDLENSLKNISEEKLKLSNQLIELQKSSGDSSLKHENLVMTLNTTVQEKEEMIMHLKTELNNNIEKVTQLIEDNKNMSEQILLKEEQAKGHADDVIKELGEKVNSLNEEIKAKSSELSEFINSIKEKDSRISSLEQNLSDQAASLIQLQNELNNVSNTLKLTESQLEEKNTAQKILEETIGMLKSHAESNSDEKQKKINLLDENIKAKSCQINEYMASIEDKENLIVTLQNNFDAQDATLLQLQNEHKELDEMLKKKDLELEEKNAKQKSLEEQINILQLQSESSISEKEEKMIDLVKEIERLTNYLQEKEELLVKIKNELDTSQANIEKLNCTIEQLTENLQQSDISSSSANKNASEKISALENELSVLKLEREQMKVEYEKECEALNDGAKTKQEELLAKNDIISQHESQISILSEKFHKNEEECSSLKNEVSTLIEKHSILLKEKENVQSSLKEKEEFTTELSKQVDSLKASLDKSHHDLEEKDKKLLSLQDSINLKEEHNNQLSSKLQVAEQKVEMLNKDSSDHVLALQAELSKLKEETTTVQTHLEQELVKIKTERENILENVNEKDKLLQEKVEILICLEKNLKEKEGEIFSLISEKKCLVQNIADCNADVEAVQKKYQEMVLNTQSEVSEKLAGKELELSTIKSDHDKLILINEEQSAALSAKEELLMSLQEKLKQNEMDVSNLTAQNTELQLIIAKFSLDIEQEQNMYKEQLNSSMLEHDSMLQEKQQLIQDIQNELKKHIEQLESKSKILQEKDGEISGLKNILNEKDSQFDELSKMIEFSQEQLVCLKEQNEKNESMLQNKESFFNDFKMEQEKQLQAKEKSFNEELAKFSSLIQSKDEELKQKEAVVSNMMLETEAQKKSIESLQAQVEIVNAEKQKMIDDSGNICQQLKKQVEEMEMKISNLLEENKKIVKAEIETKEAKKGLELVRDSLLQEKSAQEATIKDREFKLEALQAEVIRMQANFIQHKQDLQQKLDVSQVELEAVAELKNQLEIQHSVSEELEEAIQAGEKRQKELEDQIEIIPIITEEKNKLEAKIEEFENANKERSKKITNLEGKNLMLEEQLNNNKNLIIEKEKDVSSLKDQLQKLQDDKIHSNNFNTSKSLEEENKLLKNKITLLELEKLEKKSDASAKSTMSELSVEEAEEKASLLSQVDFLNSIIVDMKQKNEELTRQLEIQQTCWDEPDVNLNETKKAIAPRLFCDICDMFDIHDTEDCPKQESFLDEETVPQLKRPGTRVLEDRPYCNNCEVFGHWTLDCNEPDTF